ncbi:MAG: L,D-transpeptidase family protein [Alphaproteobacteria bacterium]|nr:L,D-transpeptidase family protein [Alphaproteobacteria bacterium]MDE2337558.1 L,D-transpeptidase family protein [Alphaproteobacteria bacterium]
MKLVVTAPSPAATTATLSVNGKTYPCTLGRAGVTGPAEKTEGDGKTPLGVYPLRLLYYRADRVAKPETGLPLKVLTPETGWCEDPSHPDYNREISLPHPAGHDHMTRADALYDYVVVVGYNDSPVVTGKGSAIFIHLARPDFSPTAGCVGLRAEDMRELLKICNETSTIEIRLETGTVA